MLFILAISLFFNFILVAFFTTILVVFYKKALKAFSKLNTRTSSIYFLNRKMFNDLKLSDDVHKN